MESLLLEKSCSTCSYRRAWYVVRIRKRAAPSPLYICSRVFMSFSLRLFYRRNCTYELTYNLRTSSCAYGVRKEYGLLSAWFSEYKKAPVRVLVNKKTISNTHFSMGNFAFQSQKCANLIASLQKRLWKI